MKKINILILMLLQSLFIPLGLAAKSGATPYTYETVEGDPLKTRIYTLSNGLKVYLSANKAEPRIQTYIAIKAGSKNDPKETTGLAHYLEHMVFKGTPHIGTLDWEKEKNLLQQISDLYERHRQTEDAEEKKKIYHMIDSISYEASKYAVPNEYDKMVSAMGAKGTNAYTSNEKTVYINDIPSNELGKWLLLESERFQALTLRLFHTELETVYEEFNRGIDNDFRKSWQSLYKGLWKNHTYGTQTTIGEGEHLKNPSMENIEKYFYTYYRPNNAAICLSGDLDYDQTIALIDKHFSSWKPAEIPAFTFAEEEPLAKPLVLENFGQQAEHLYMGWRIPKAGTREHLLMELVSSMLSNDQAGIFDIEILQKQKALDASAIPIVLKDHCAQIIYAVPRQNQPLEELKDLILTNLDKLKNGEFEPWLIDAVVKNKRLEQYRSFEKNQDRGHYLVDAFILDADYYKWVHLLDEMATVTKQEIIDFSKKYYGTDNYVVVYKRVGEDPNVHKVAKPAITPVVLNRDKESEFYTSFNELKSARIAPEFIDFTKAITFGTMGNKPYLYIENTENPTFSLYYILDMGTDADTDFSLLAKYLPLLGTDRYTPEQFQQELYKNALSLDFNTQRDRFFISISGLDESYSKGIELMEHFLHALKADEETFSDLIDNIIKQRADNKLSKNVIFNQALFNYGRFGKLSPFTDIFSEAQLRAMKGESLVNKAKKLLEYKHRIFYYGPQSSDDAKAIIGKYHQAMPVLRDYPKPRFYTEQATDENQVLFCNYKQKQVEIMLLSKDKLFDKELMAPAYIFNEYFGSGLSSIVFQEIREAKALAYSAYSVYTTPAQKSEAHYVRAYLGTQSDKLNDAISALLALMNDMPQAAIQFEGARDAAIKTIESERITGEKIFVNYESAQRRGLSEDIRRELYPFIEKMTMADLKKFFDENIKGRSFTYLVLGDKNSLEMSELEKLGKVKELSLEELFGY